REPGDRSAKTGPQGRGFEDGAHALASPGRVLLLDRELRLGKLDEDAVAREVDDDERLHPLRVRVVLAEDAVPHRTDPVRVRTQAVVDEGRVAHALTEPDHATHAHARAH